MNLRPAIRGAFALGLLASPPAVARAQTTERASEGAGGVQGNNASSVPYVSAGGRYVAFYSDATNLVPSDTNGQRDVFLRDRTTGTLEIVSLTAAGGLSNFGSFGGPVTSDGRYVAFGSSATNLVAGDTNNAQDVFVRDRQLGTTERVSVATGGAQGNSNSGDWISISADGRYVAYSSTATNLVAGDTNGTYDVFVRDRQTGTTERVSLATGGAQGNGTSVNSYLSGDGRYVAFRSAATNLVAGDTNGVDDVFVRDRQTGATARVSVTTGGGQSNGACNNRPSISADGRYVEFDCAASNLVAGDTNGTSDVFVHDRQTGQTTRASIATGGAQANGATFFGQISPDGSTVGFQSFATNLVAGDTNGVEDLFVHHRPSGTTERASVSSSGAQANGSSGYAALSGDGRYVAFESNASNLVAADTNAAKDVFLRDRTPSIANDDCATAQPIAGAGTTSFDSTNATTGVEGQGNSGCGAGIVRDVWFAWTADFSGTAQLSLCNQTAIDSKIAVYAGAGCPGGSALACNEDACSSQSSLCFPTTAGAVYLLQIGSGPGSGGGTGTFTLSPSSVVSGACAPIDDGTAEQALAYYDATNGAGGATGWMQRFGEIGQSTTVTAISSAWSSPIAGPSQLPPEGSPVQVAIWDDPNDDGNPIDGVLLQLVGGNLTGAGTNAFQTFALNPPVTVSGYFFVGAGLSNGFDQYPAPLDQPGTCSGFNRAWSFGCYGDNCPLQFANLAANQYPPTSLSNWVYGASQLLVRPTCGGSTVFCVPGQSGVIACPCSNPGQPGRGCDNSSATGGAVLNVSGNSSLSADTVVFTTAGEKPTAISIVLQGNQSSAGGAVYGMGVRCTAGSLKRLYTKTASGGSITAPQPGDPSVSARSAALGDPLAPGAVRYYQVYYRDPTVLGGCPPSSTLNITQGIVLTWL